MAFPPLFLSISETWRFSKAKPQPSTDFLESLNDENNLQLLFEKIITQHNCPEGTPPPLVIIIPHFLWYSFLCALPASYWMFTGSWLGASFG